MKLNRLEISMIVAFFLLFAYAWSADNSRQQVADDVIRLHVVAHSDKREDQALKLLVRDRILQAAAPLLEGADTHAQSEAILIESMQTLVDEAQKAVFEHGRDERVCARLVRDHFPTKDYETFALPAGQYKGLRFEIGAAEGENWWCVVFPPLCTGAASNPVEHSGLSAAEQNLITKNGTSYRLKFKAAEWIGEIRHFFS